MLDDLPSRTNLKSGPPPQHLAFTFMALVLFFLVGLDIWQSWTARTQALRVAELSTANLARSLAQHAETTVQQADTVLGDLVERVQTDGLGPAQIQRLHHLLQERRGALELHGLFIYDKDGHWLVTSNDADPIGVNNADREYFLYHRTTPGPAPHIGAVIRSRSSDELVIPISRRIDDAEGRFAGVALATLKMDDFNRFYASFALDRQGVIVLALRNGTILARRPYEENTIGSSLAKSHVFSDLLPNAPSGTQLVPSIIDGVPRMLSYRALERYPLVVEAAESKDAILAVWYANLWRSVAFILIASIAMGVLGRTLIRQIRRSQRNEADLRNTHAALQKLAMQDDLTGLANRRQLDIALPHEIGRARRNGRPLGLIMIDIDHFKRFNDLYGHPAGDHCIRSVGQTLLACVGRTGDLVVRYGGEELLVLLPESGELGTWLVAEKILYSVRALNIQHAGSDTSIVTISAGVYAWPANDPAADAHTLIRAADDALYKAKRGGRNRIYPPSAGSGPGFSHKT
jgi:diguanylate cyclase